MSTKAADARGAGGAKTPAPGASPAPASGPAQPAPLSGATLAIVSIALALGTFMQVLDTTIANVALTTIAGNLGESADTSIWVITAFAVANGISLPLTGWLMQRFGVVRTFVGAVILFSIASMLCGLAWSLPSLIAFRILQGAVSGPMVPGSQALLISIYPPEKRATALGIWSITTLVAPVAGPILGGYISDNYHWGWIFLINVPVGLFAGGVAWFVLGRNAPAGRKLPVDIGGLLLLALWVGSLQIMLDLGKNDDWFNSPRIVVMAIVAVVGFAAWLIWELTEKNPIVDLSLFKRRNFAFGTAALALAYALFFAGILLMPLWQQQQLGYTATWAGLTAAPAGVVAVIMTPFIARISGKIDARILGTVSLALLALSFFVRSHLTAQADVWAIIVPALILGASISMFFLSLLTIILDGLPPERVGSASGIATFVRTIFAAFAASSVTTLWDRREALHQTRLADAATIPYADVATRLQGMGMTELQAAASVTRQLVGQGYLLATTDIFWAAGWVALILIGLLWMARRPAAHGGPVAAD